MLTKSIKGIALLALLTLAACEGGQLRKRNCKNCETVITNRDGSPGYTTNKRVCGDDEVAAFIIANTSSSLSVVTTCK